MCKDEYSFIKYLINILISGNIIFNYLYVEYERNINPQVSKCELPIGGLT